ncbi:hypothetical protein PEP31012_03674 [Pandoraea eparura]|uniref:Uncharacterized protein n=1 Tax=Pandoraea eparura TaxID=2508291 RepID=A0A5E4X400_9BURK|nr:hypothetical protein [Pandoraea eparura]VVE30968.1 hypothetical protein PEP31012_03674 [Pandoraea eparura]
MTNYMDPRPEGLNTDPAPPSVVETLDDDPPNSYGCGYEGAHFGAPYIDAICIEGELWDLDAFEDGMLVGGGNMPCPCCNTREYLEYQDYRYTGNARNRRAQIRKDIRRILRLIKERKNA